jgi:hypothetical protein
VQLTRAHLRFPCSVLLFFSLALCALATASDGCR